MKLIKLLILLSLFLTGKASMASHSMGADLTYECLGQDINGNWMYKLHYTFYRDCSGITPTNPMTVDYSSTCFPGMLSVTMNLDSITDISHTCPTVANACDTIAGIYSGIQVYSYTGIATLQGPCADWTFYHSESARNAAITTTLVSGNLHVFSVINNTIVTCNNSPVFSNKPVALLCLGQAFFFNHGAYDPEGDSLSYELITPRTGPTLMDTVTYDATHSRLQPVLSNPPMTFNSSTGEFRIIPVQAEVSIMAVLVSEWRNGVLIGQVERDIQVSVENCNNSIPTLWPITNNPGSAYSATVCANESNCFYIRSRDFDSSQTTTISWDNSIPGANVTRTGGNRDSLLFCWTPTNSDTSSTPRCFTVTVSDDNCPYLGIQNFTFCLTVSNNVNCVPLVTGIPERFVSDNNLKIYPQPANDYFIAEIPENTMNRNELIIQNALGVIAHRFFLNGNSNRIEISDLKSGFYFVSLTGKGNEILSRRILVVNR